MVEQETTTIRIRYETKKRLDDAKIIPDEIYDSEINRLLDLLEKEKERAIHA
jgi:hypothetical protein